MKFKSKLAEFSNGPVGSMRSEPTPINMKDKNPLYNERYDDVWVACRAGGVEPVNVWYEGGKTHLKFKSFQDAQVFNTESVRKSVKGYSEIVTHYPR